MRYASIRNLDISNGSNVGVALFVQGCDFHCNECFNSETWDFDGGEEWNNEIKNYFFELLDRPFIKRCSILGGEPLHPNNVIEVYNICKTIKESYPDKTIWLYTGYDFEDIWIPRGSVIPQNCNPTRDLRNGILKYIDVLVDGQYVHQQRDITLAFRGSSNQRLIDVQKTLYYNSIVLFEE